MRDQVESNFPVAGARDGSPSCLVSQPHHSDGGGISNNHLNNKITSSGRALCAALTIGTLASAGCASVGRQVDQSQADQIQKGVHTKADVRARIGSPDKISKESGGEETWTYSYERATVKGTSFIPLVGGFVGGVNTQTQEVVVSFDTEGKVTRVLSSYGGTQMNENLSAGRKPAMTDVDADKRAK